MSSSLIMRKPSDSIMCTAQQEKILLSRAAADHTRLRRLAMNPEFSN
jgi:hypothetical protein